MLGLVTHAFSSSIWEAGAGGSLWVWEQPDQQSKIQASHDYTTETLPQKNVEKIEDDREREREGGGEEGERKGGREGGREGFNPQFEAIMVNNIVNLAGSRIT